MKKKNINSEILKKYSARNNRSLTAAKHNESRDWKLFGLRIVKNYHVRNHLIERQNNLCPICNERVTRHRGAMHHLDYDHICQRDCLLKYAKRFVPNCQICQIETPDFFNSCADRLVFVHRSCHFHLHHNCKTEL